MVTLEQIYKNRKLIHFIQRDSSNDHWYEVIQLSEGDEYNTAGTGRGENGKGIMEVLNSQKIKSKKGYQIRKVEHFLKIC